MDASSETGREASLRLVSEIALRSMSGVLLGASTKNLPIRNHRQEIRTGNSTRVALIRGGNLP